MSRIVSFTLLAMLAAAILAQGQTPSTNLVAKMDPALDAIIPPDLELEKIVTGLGTGEGPVWVRNGGYLLFSDIPANTIKKWTPDGKVTVVLEPSGFTGTDASDVGMEMDNGISKVYLIGSNGITLDHERRIIFCAQGDRAIIRIEKDGKRTVLADHFEGKRLNSPNDLVYKSDGTLYFTDPPAGLRRLNDDPKKELPFNGVYFIKGTELHLATKDVTFPNGLAFSPGEKYLYVNNTLKKTITRFDAQADDTITNGRLFIDMSADKAEGVPDGMKVDRKGNVYCTGPGGLWIMSPEGRHLGTIHTPRLTNFTFGDADGRTLYMTGLTAVYRMRVKIPGIRAQ